MVHPVHTTAKTNERPGSEFAVAAGQRWDNEGGATPEASASATMGAPTPLEASPEQMVMENARTKARSSVLDARQEEIMAATSSDGRPPKRWVRILEWRWFTISAFGVIALMAAWIIGNSFTSRALLHALPYGVLLLLAGASPVIVSGLMRAKEERASRRLARATLPTGRVG